MIILNQNKNVIVNFDSVSTIERNGHKINCYFKDSPCPLLIGDYPTDKRAEEVLADFFECFMSGMDANMQSDGCTNSAIYFNMPSEYYMMPKE